MIVSEFKALLAWGINFILISSPLQSSEIFTGDGIETKK